MRLGGIITAMVTPFDADGSLDEDAVVRLMHHLLENGSDGLVAGRHAPARAPTLTDEEKCGSGSWRWPKSGGATIVGGHRHQRHAPYASS